MKYLVETPDNTQLKDIETGQLVPFNRPAVIRPTGFFEAKIFKGQMRRLADLDDQATDEEFQNYLRDSDNAVPLAVAAFKSAFGVEPPEDDEDGEDDEDTQVRKPSDKGDREKAIAQKLSDGVAEADLKQALGWKPSQADIKAAVKLNLDEEAD